MAFQRSHEAQSKSKWLRKVSCALDVDDEREMGAWPAPGGGFRRAFADVTQHRQQPDETLRGRPSPSQLATTMPQIEGRKAGSPAPLPPVLCSRLESLSGADLTGVRVYHGSELPGAVGALAYTQGTDIYLGPGQEHHLAHEGWHTVQQMQGRVSPTTAVNGVPVNDHPALEAEADAMGAQARSGNCGHSLQITNEESGDDGMQQPQHVRALWPFAQLNQTDISAAASGGRSGMDVHVQEEGQRPPLGQAEITTRQRLWHIGVKGAPLIQLFVDANLDKQGFVVAKGNGKRPSGSLSGGSQGEHTTPYVTLEHAIVNAIKGITLEKAWKNLLTTHKTIVNLPGYGESAKWLTKRSDEILGEVKIKGPEFVSIADLAEYANNLLTIRNQITYSSLPTGPGGSIGGQNEATTAGALQVLEGKVRNEQSNYYDKYTKKDVLITMWDAFDHTSFYKLNQNDPKRKAIVRQHAETMVDAYWRTATHYKISAEDVINAPNAP